MATSGSDVMARDWLKRLIEGAAVKKIPYKRYKGIFLGKSWAF